MARMRKLLCAVLCVALVMCALCVPVVANAPTPSPGVTKYYQLSGKAYFNLYDADGTSEGTQEVTMSTTSTMQDYYFDNQNSVEELQFKADIEEKIDALETAGYTVTKKVDRKWERTDGGNVSGLDENNPIVGIITYQYEARKASDGNDDPGVDLGNYVFTFHGTMILEYYENGKLIKTDAPLTKSIDEAKPYSDIFVDFLTFSDEIDERLTKAENEGYVVEPDAERTVYSEGWSLVTRPLDGKDLGQASPLIDGEQPAQPQEVELSMTQVFKASRTVETQHYYPDYDEEPAEQEAVVEEPVEAAEEDVSPKTGDAGNEAAVVMLAAAAALCVCGAMLKRRSA